jgi:hypothetical protein
MPNLSEMRGQLLERTKEQVRAELGEPERVTYWQNMKPPPEADEAALAEFRRTLLDEIWVYSNGRVHFSLEGRVLKVDDDTSHDLQSDSPPVA